LSDALHFIEVFEGGGDVPKQADGSELYFVFRVTAYIVFKFVDWIALGYLDLGPINELY